VQSIVGWGLVGLGRIAPRVAAACAGAKHSRLAAVCSRDETKAAGFAQEHGAGRGYGSFDAMLADPTVDAVYICTPNALHAPQTIAAARAGKHVFCEKPMALTADECVAMIAACSTAGVRLGIGYHLRQHAVLREMRRRVAAGELGDVLLARAHFFVGATYFRGGWKSDAALAGGGAIMSAGVHSLDALRFVLGREVAAVSATADALPIEEILACVLRFEGGTLAYTDTSRVVPFAHTRNDLLVHGSLASDVGAGALGGRPTGRHEITSATGTRTTEMTGPDLYTAEVEEFVRCVREGGEPSATAIDGLRAVEITEAIYESIRTAREVRVRRHEVREPGMAPSAATTPR